MMFTKAGPFQIDPIEDLPEMTCFESFHRWSILQEFDLSLSIILPGKRKEWLQ